MTASHKESQIMVSIDAGSSNTAIAVLTQCDRKISIVRAWENTPDRTGLRGSERPELPSVTYCIDDKFYYGWPPPNIIANDSQTIRAIKTYIDDGDGANALAMKETFQQKVKSNMTTGEAVYKGYLDYTLEHTRQHLQDQGLDLGEDPFSAVIFLLPPTFQRPDRQDKVKHVASGWNFDKKGYFVSEHEAALNSAIEHHHKLQEDVKNKDGTNIILIDCGGMIMNWATVNIKTWTLPEHPNVTHRVIREIADPACVNAGTEYILVEISKRAGKHYDYCVDQFLNMPETPADINYPNDNGGNYTITADDIQSWQDQYYGVAVKFFKDKLKALNDLVKKKRYLLPKYILYVGGSARSKRLSKDMNELFNEFFPSAKIIGSKQQSTANCKGALIPFKNWRLDDDIKFLRYLYFGVYVDVELPRSSQQKYWSKPSLMDEKRMFILKKRGQDFHEFTDASFDYIREFNQKHSKEKISEMISKLEITPCYFVGKETPQESDIYHPYFRADKFAVDGVAMDPINLGISHEQCNTLADDISRSGRPFHYNVTLKFAESDEFLLVVGSGGKTISEVRLQLARDIAGSGRFNFVAWSSTPDLTIIPFKSANGIGGEPIQSNSAALDTNQADLSISKRRNPAQDDPNLTQSKRRKLPDRRTRSSNNSEEKQSIDIAEDESGKGVTNLTKQTETGSQECLPSIAALLENLTRPKKAKFT